MTSWPNWVDLIVVSLILTIAYRAFHRGLITGILNLLGVVFVTSSVIAYQPKLLEVMESWLKIESPTAEAMVFWTSFLVAMTLLFLVLNLIARIYAWERLNTITQIFSLAVGLLRGAWWAGIVLLAFSSSGMEYLQKSTDERSVTAPLFLPPMRSMLERLVSVIPGGEPRPGSLIPPVASSRS